MLQGSSLEQEGEDERRTVHLMGDTLHLSGVGEANSGEYACEVTNPVGTATSNGVMVTVAGQNINHNIFFL